MTTQLAARLMSSQLPDLVFTTSAARLTVALYDPAGDERFLEVTLHATSGAVTLYEVRDVVEQRMRALDEARMNMRVLWKEPDAASWTSQGVAVHYCDKDVNGDALTWLDTHVLSTLDWKPLPPSGVSETLYFYERVQGADVTPSMTVSYRGSDGTVSHLTIAASEPLTSTDAVQSVTWTVATVRQRVAAVVDGEFTVLAVTVRVGERTMQYYRAEPLPNASFLFLNCFNVPEWAWLTCSTVTKTKDERKVGFVARRRVLYNPSRAVEHEVQTSALPLEHARWIDQLFTSGSVWLADGTPVVVTEGECGVSDDNGALNSVKFTWLRADGRGSLTVTARAARIFTEEFTYQFT